MMVIGLALGLVTLMSSTCNKEEDPADPGQCSGYVSAVATGGINANFCFTTITTFTYEPNNLVTLWARQADNYGFDVSLYSDNQADLVPGTYTCGSGGFAFVELIFEDPADPSTNEFYKSQSGTLTVTQVNQNSFKGSFNVVAVGYYNGKSINFSGTFTN